MTRKPKDLLTAAECARRTGLTVRALRVYERAGLIRPPRSAKGWRQYGESELKRLNVITTLKSVGFSLLQIRRALESEPPSLEALLRMQLEAAQTRSAQAQRTIERLQRALQRLADNGGMSLAELCELVRDTEPPVPAALARQLIGERITADEERRWINWWRERHVQGMALNLYAKEQRVLFGSLRKLMENGASPAAAAVQQLIGEWNALLLKYHVRALLVEATDWNAELTGKWIALGRQLSEQTSPSSDPVLNRRTREFFVQALRESAWSRQLTALLDEAAGLLARGAHTDSAAARELVRELDGLCRRHRLGDAGTFVRWSCAPGLVPEPPASAMSPAEYERRQGAWRFLEQASRAH
ncbi:MAG TPA: MerR family transcriptional regulator [Steroidobacteraceae bacterium]|nr:MerR family transcriptional regulator [Steroidobacteraceae bacterium]